MGASLLIMLREGLEMAIIVAILLAYLNKIGRHDRVKAVWVGVGAAAAVCVVAAVIFSRVVDKFASSSAEPWVEGFLALTAGSVLTWMIFWMRGHARGIASTLHSKVDAAIERGSKAIAIMAFVAVAREGFETVLFMIGAQEATKRSAIDTIVGGTIGLAIAIAIAIVIYGYGHRINLAKFFSITGGLLILFAAGLLAKAGFELAEAMKLTGLQGDSLWTITSGPFANGWVHDFLQGIFGWSANEASPLRVSIYGLYLVPVTWLFYFSGRVPKASSDRSSPSTTTPAPA